MTDLELINKEILDLNNVLDAVCNLSKRIDENIDLFNKFEKSKFKTSKILKNNITSGIKEILLVIDEYKIDFLSPEALDQKKKELLRQIELLKNQQNLLEQKEKVNSFQESKRLKNTFLENEVLLYEKSNFYTKESASFHLTNIFLLYLLNLWNFIHKNLLSSSAIFIFIGFASVLPYFIEENLPIAEVSNIYLVYAGIWGAIIFIYLFLFLMPYLYSNFYLYKINVKKTISVKIILSLVILSMMIFFLVLNNLSSLPKNFSEFLEQNIEIIKIISDKIINLLYIYMIAHVIIAIMFLAKKEITASPLICIAFVFEILYLMIFIKNPTFLVFLSFVIILLLSLAFANYKFDYKIAITIGLFFTGLSFFIIAPNIARIAHIANYHDDFWIENKFIIDLNITTDKYMCNNEEQTKKQTQNKDKNETKKEQNIEQEDIFDKQIYSCIKYVDENETKFKNLLVRTKTDDRYYLRAIFKENNKSIKSVDFSIPRNKN
ncbi:hypothetical protein [Campylobacter hyointestinalis]|uniref:hypothetical protein n=1 Tax=Campylobacter hyointestinalis TaxID=198 RepID=UPI000DCAF573|nr:hypothetical protein [Campylobacter hyointestinalis]RAZ23560.1 hypothetical protein CHL9752_07265 [Campylobacter hyointestinalis subsp. lawsonii]RAZ37737.1 hypothetical protein CHL9426_07950 [Campylobacter hyointestinalis subsp. lawsonii]RAZ51272.1 hypothetical protein CHL10075_07795 [Campylobacter hyointestinalis subsp. lawsonii]